VFVGSVVVYGAGRDYDPSDVVQVLRAESFGEPTSTFDSRPRAHRDLREQIDAVEPWHAEKLQHTVWNDVCAETAFQMKRRLTDVIGCWEDYATRKPDTWRALCVQVRDRLVARRKAEKLRDERQANTAMPNVVYSRSRAVADAWQDLIAYSDEQPKATEPSKAWYEALDQAIAEREARQAREASESGQPVPQLRKGKADRSHADRWERIALKGMSLADAVRYAQRWQAAHGHKVAAVLAAWGDTSDAAASDAEYVLRYGS
jgi:hypothetical protein